MSTKNRRVAVFGIGPSGLAAAYAAHRNGYEVTLFSNSDKPSALHGCQYLHSPLPDIDVPKALVNFSLQGTIEGYRRKVYGNAWVGAVSPGDFGGVHSAWDLRETYRLLWKHVGDTMSLLPYQASPVSLELNANDLRRDFDLVISTVPATALCGYPAQHTFHTQKIYAVGDNATLNYNPGAKDEIICNGEPDVAWYRQSNVFGVGTIEYPGNKPKPPIEGIVQVEKPLWTDCDCFPWIQRLGRYGSWRKSVLVHDVYRQTNWLTANVLDGKAFVMNKHDKRDLCRMCGKVAIREQRSALGDKTVYACIEKHSWEGESR